LFGFLIFLQISPRQGLLRVREFTLAEIEHFVDPEDKSHPKYAEVADLEFFMFPREEQMSDQSAKRIRLGDAVSKVSFNNIVAVNTLFTHKIAVYYLPNHML